MTHSTQYRQLFADDYAETGNDYYYRVRARNAAGVSAPSNAVGPVPVDENVIVDELSDFSRLFGHDNVTLETAIRALIKKTRIGSKAAPAAGSSIARSSRCARPGC